MEIIERKENSILNRIELTWQWSHTGAATPTRAQIIAAVMKMEPSATKDCVVIKSVNTRFGQPLTTGNALVYGDRADFEKEPKYILAKHGGTEEEAPAEVPTEAPTEAPTEDSQAAEIAGGEE